MPGTTYCKASAYQQTIDQDVNDFHDNVVYECEFQLDMSLIPLLLVSDW